MTVSSIFLRFDIRSEWHLGSGRDGGAYADSLVLKTHNQLPFLSGKSIKGLLRQAFFDALFYGWLKDADEQSVLMLFGQEGRDEQSQGQLRIGSATLSDTEIAYFSQYPKAKKQLYNVRYFTAIDAETGVAKAHSLRAMETVIPLILEARIDMTNLSVEARSLFIRWLSTALPLIEAVGGKRRRGMGDVIVTVKEAY